MRGTVRHDELSCDTSLDSSLSSLMTSILALLAQFPSSLFSGAHEVRVHYQNCSEVFPFLFHFPHGKNGRNEKKYEESGFPIGPRFTCTYVLPYVFRVTFYVKPFVLYLTLSILQEVNIDVTAIHLNFILTGHPVCFLEFFGNH